MPAPAPPPRPLHLSGAAITQVAFGGALGAAARDALEQAWPTATGGFPAATLTINLSGALLLGLLLESLVRAGEDSGGRRRARLVLGTGFMGAYTTYSTFAVEADLLVRGGRSGTAVAYVVLTVAAGLLATVAGIAIGATRGRREVVALPADPDVDEEGPGTA